MITWWMKLGGNLPLGHDALLFSTSGMGSLICSLAQTRLDIPMPLITQSHRHGWTYQCLWLPSHTDTAGQTYQGLWLPSHTDTAGHTKAFDYPVTQTQLDIPRSLITQSHRHGWTYQGLWLPSHTDTAGHTKAFDYPVTQTRLDIPRPLNTQSHRHGWTYQGLWLPSHTDTAGHTKAFDYPVTDTAGHTKAFDYPVTQTRLDIPRPLTTQSHRHGWTYQGLWLPSHTDTAGHTKAFDYPVTQTRLDIPRPLTTQSQTRLDIPRPLTTQLHRHGWTYQGLWLPSHTDTARHTKAFDYPVTQTRLDIPRPLTTQSHRHGWTYQGLWLPCHELLGGKSKWSGFCCQADSNRHRTDNQSIHSSSDLPPLEILADCAAILPLSSRRSVMYLSNSTMSDWSDLAVASSTCIISRTSSFWNRQEGIK